MTKGVSCRSSGQTHRLVTSLSGLLALAVAQSLAGRVVTLEVAVAHFVFATDFTLTAAAVVRGQALAVVEPVACGVVAFEVAVADFVRTTDFTLAAALVVSQDTLAVVEAVARWVIAFEISGAGFVFAANFTFAATLVVLGDTLAVGEALTERIVAHEIAVADFVFATDLTLAATFLVGFRDAFAVAEPRQAGVVTLQSVFAQRSQATHFSLGAAITFGGHTLAVGEALAKRIIAFEIVVADFVLATDLPLAAAVVVTGLHALAVRQVWSPWVITR